MLDVDQTIAAIASAPGPAARGIIRITGPDAVQVLERVFQGDADSLDKSRPYSMDGQLGLGEAQFIAGTAMVWPDTRSYTRQPSVELHLLGAPVVLQLLLDQVCLQGARLAAPGEFTLRAFLSGRIDLTQAEAVLAVIDSDSSSQFEVALQQLAGGLAGPLGGLRDQLLSVLAELEAGLDFVEEDIEFISTDQLSAQLEQCQQELRRIVDQVAGRDVCEVLPRVTLIGLPNSGKSSLFNRLTGRDAAIVSDVAGTTTDFVSATVELDAGQSRVTQAIQLIDTAGFEQTEDDIMVAAQSHRETQASQAELRILCIDPWASTTLAEGEPVKAIKISPWDAKQLNNLHESDVVVLTKLDQGGKLDAEQWEQVQAIWVDAVQDQRGGEKPIWISNTDGRGVDELQRQMSESLFGRGVSSESAVASTVRRAAESLREADGALRAARSAVEQELGEEIVAAEIREALQGLAQVVGEVYTDDILDIVFGRFCIGK